jgi:hypothetical protein
MALNKNFLLNIKYKLHYMNECLEKIVRIKEEVSRLIKQNNLDIELDLNNLINEIDDNSKLVKQLHKSKCIDNTEDDYIKIIKQLNKSKCDHNHNIIDDYIETGVEDCMQKIKYCDICFTTF